MRLDRVPAVSSNHVRPVRSHLHLAPMRLINLLPLFALTSSWSISSFAEELDLQGMHYGISSKNTASDDSLGPADVNVRAIADTRDASQDLRHWSVPDVAGTM